MRLLWVKPAILSVHNQYRFLGGEDICRSAETQLLREEGHRVDEWTVDNQSIVHSKVLQTAIRTLWANESYRTMQKYLKSSLYEIVHIHNFFPLISPSVYYAASERQIPVVQTVHNYRLLCPNALFYRDGHVCVECMTKKLAWPGVLHACYRESRAATGVVAGMLALHELLGTWKSKISMFIALTEFSRRKLIEGGLPENRVMVKPNFVHPDPGCRPGSGGYALFVGRLSTEKGIRTLLSAWHQLQDEVELKIVGDGPLQNDVVTFASKYSSVEWLGEKSQSEVMDLMGNASVVIVPSECYETFGRVVIESFAVGTPVIAGQIGALDELVDHQRTGLQFKSGDPKDLVEQVEWAFGHPDALQAMRKEARQEFLSKYTAEVSYNILSEVYEIVQADTGVNPRRQITCQS